VRVAGAGPPVSWLEQEREMSRTWLKPAWPACVLALLAACAGTDDARVLQVLNQRGFGRPTQDANRQYYVGIGDTITLQDRIHPEYNGVTETVRMDGVVTLPEVGEVYINGLSPDEITQVLQLKFEQYVNDTSGMSVRVMTTTSKRYYITGLPPRLTKSFPFTGDVLLIDAIERGNVDQLLVDEQRIRVLRGDPENPLVIECNYEDIQERGLTRDNILIRENDVIYLTPSIVGWLTYFVSLLLAPLEPVEDLLFGWNNVVSISDSFGEGTVGQYNNNNNPYYGGF
jgi:polysaccharide biosynthesis/export protein